MGASEWRKAAEAYANKFLDVSKEAARIIQAENELMEFFMSDEWQAAGVLLLAGNESIFLGRLSFDLSSSREYRLGGHGLYHHNPSSGASYFKATPLDAVRAFYWYRNENVNMVARIREILDFIAKQMLKEANG